MQHKTYNSESARKYQDTFLFAGNRNPALQRDKEKCVMCGMTREEHKKKYGRDITVDHIDGRGKHTKDKNNSLENLETLCLVCHGKKDRKRRSNRKQKLNEEKVIYIRKNYPERSFAGMAREFGVAVTTVQSAYHKLSFKWVGGKE